ncbi:MAG TPA: energy-coupling factor transporter transmembrane component T [Opitutaceae bacterium]|nr:energy-coupling factor transporter transmembrane component T [Opitutaceae bacterium]
MSLPKFQTVERETVFSRLDFRSKLAVFVSLTGVAVLWSQPLLSVSLASAVLIACLWVGVPRGYLGFILRVMTPFFLLLLLTHGFFNVRPVLRLTGQSELTALFRFPENWWVVGGAMLSREGLLYGVNVIAKSLTFLLLVPLCVFTTDPNNLVLGLVRLRLPYKLAFLISSTLRFFPLLFDEIHAVIETQRLRGFALEEMSTLERVKTYSKIAVPIVLGAMFKAQQIEVVLQSKAFSGNAERTYLHDSKLRSADGWVIGFSAVVLMVVGLLYAVAGFGHFGRPITFT